MQDNKSVRPFWDLIDELDQKTGSEDHFSWLYRPKEFQQDIASLVRVLGETVPGADAWQHDVDGHPAYLLPAVLGCLCHGSSPGGSYEPSPTPDVRWGEGDTRLEVVPDGFEDLLYQRAPRGATSFLWTCYSEYEGSVATIGNRQTRLVTSVRSRLYDPEDVDEEHGYYTPSAAAIGIARGKKLELYPFPPEWWKVVNRVHREVSRMTARRRAEREMTHELRGFVDLLGWEAVNKALQRLRP